MKIFSIYDSKAEYYWTPRFEKSAGEVLRALADAVNTRGLPAAETPEVAKHPEDYTLFQVGEWDQDTCKFVIYDAKIPLGCCIEFVRDPGNPTGTPVTLIQGEKEDG